MKAVIECRENCITVKTKYESETLYDSDIVNLLPKFENPSDFTDSVYDYFDSNLDDAEINYKELQKVCKKVYKNLK